MGDHFSKYLLPQLWRQDEPSSYAPIKYDPQFGFEGRPRKLKEPRITTKEMDSANLEDRVRDLCAHIRVVYRGCIVHNSPFVWRCKGLSNELGMCYANERIHDMKEFEREKRLNARERRIAQASA